MNKQVERMMIMAGLLMTALFGFGAATASAAGALPTTATVAVSSSQDASTGDIDWP
ncbi:hypothetical protein ACFV97_14050 [Streptomyces sp. NPDC059913]|uniref:hypothetical protein n=1 Tax=unclassified Streptomyces TaxID=2593676 RepID=UPI003659CE9B